MQRIAHNLVTAAVRVIAGAALTACASSPTSVSLPASVILGEWSYASGPASPESPSLNAGFHVTIVIDSLAGTQFRGRVAHWFAGDVGVSPAAFGPVAGTLDPSGAVTLRIPITAPRAADIMIVGRVVEDVLAVSQSLLGSQPGPFPSGACFERRRISYGARLTTAHAVAISGLSRSEGPGMKRLSSLPQGVRNTMA